MIDKYSVSLSPDQVREIARLLELDDSSADEVVVANPGGPELAVTFNSPGPGHRQRFYLIPLEGSSKRSA